MSVLYPSDRGEPWAPCAQDCFVCGDAVPVSVPAVMWAGTCHEGSILLHDACAAKLGAELVKDSREAELASGTGPHLTRRLARALHAATTTQELRA